MKHSLFSQFHANRLASLLVIIGVLFIGVVLTISDPSLLPLTMSGGALALGQINVMTPQEQLKAEALKLKSQAPIMNIATDDPWLKLTNIIRQLIGNNLTFWSGRDGIKKATGYVDPAFLLKQKVDAEDKPTGEPMVTFLGVGYARFLDLFGALADLVKLHGKNSPTFEARKFEGGRIVQTSVRFAGLQSDGTLGFFESNKAVGGLGNASVTDKLHLDIPRRSSGFGNYGAMSGGDALRAFGPSTNEPAPASYDTSALDGITL